MASKMAAKPPAGPGNGLVLGDAGPEKANVGVASGTDRN